MILIHAGMRPHVEKITDERLGVTAEKTREASFWQSRATLAGRPFNRIELTDINELAREVRRGETNG